MYFDLLITNAMVLRQPGKTGHIIDPGFVGVTGDVIAAVGRMDDLGDSSGAEVLDASGRLVMPGLVNCHVHGAMTLFRGMADDLPLMEWLTGHIFPAEAKHVSPEMVYWCSKLAAAEMIMSGITTAADGYFFEDSAAQAFADAGLRAVAAQGVIDFPAPGVPDPKENVEAAEHFIDKWQGRDSLILPAVFCHSPYTCGAETLLRAKGLARQRAVPFFIHVAETRFEVEECRAMHGLTPVGFLEKIGLLDDATVCVHGVWMTGDDLDILASSGAAVVHCPESNMKLASGVAPLSALLDRGIPLGLGTDGCASNNDLDLFREMASCAMLHKVAALDPTVAPAARLLDMATAGGARALSLHHDIGNLVVGKKADLIVVNRNHPRLTPLYSPDLLVYAASGADVSSSIIGGRVVMENRQIQTFSVQEVCGKVTALSAVLRENA